ncbi:FtsX-like permease family protein [Salipaludibacillus aurantiacus]|uniref:Putative ABC transport system permease protein n=1 Tax=Salipaludibacillus aurantiacus TaxID=1601833 RepID=A0A1H9Q6E4_9BACI|nr:FtsX-like permease family protein [Salipaludibacillus aurantiacus]SER55992.1 putative ABC transport system permease protein [Salipaludibacillus aurantiacus]
MNIVNRLTIRHLKENKKRTSVTIVGVIISVAMITAVATLSLSFMDLLQREHIKNEGEWHVLYKGVNDEQLSAVEADEQTEKVILSEDLGYAELDNSRNQNKPYLFVRAFNSSGFDQFPVELSEGRFPEASDEIVLSDHIADNAQVYYEIGDELTIDVGERQLTNEESSEAIGQSYSLRKTDQGLEEELIKTAEESYTITGFIERPTWEPVWAPGYTVLTAMDEETIDGNNRVDAYVVMDKVTRSVYDDAQQLADDNHIALFEFNNELLRYYGVTNSDGLVQRLYYISGLIIAVIIVGSVALIYNAFAISVSERSRHLGMLASVGATRRQKMNSVLFEGAVIGLISLPVGMLAGLLGIGTTFWFINSLLESALDLTEGLRVVVTPMLILISAVISLVTIFISAYLPARKASKISAIEAIRQTADVKLTKKKVKTPKIVRKLFGIEAEVALKNLKRNKRRYQITVFSLVISIVLFLSVSFFTSSLERSVALSQQGVTYDIEVYINESNRDIEEQLTASITSFPEVTESNTMQWLSAHSLVTEENLGEMTEEWAEEDPSMLYDGKFPYNADVYSLDDEALAEYAAEVGADPAVLHNETVPAGILVDMVSYYDYESEVYVESQVIKKETGNSITLSHFDWGTGEPTEETDVTIAALTDQLPMGANSGHETGLILFVSEDVFNSWLDTYAPGGPQTEVYLRSSDPLKTEEDINDMNSAHLSVYNLYRHRQQEEQMMTIISVFIYGFIVLITAISIANIFNTISTSLSLRKREFAMLKSVGMAPGAFTKMMNFESLFYGIKALLYGIPISIAVMYMMHHILMDAVRYSFSLPWLELLYVIIAVFVIVSASMMYAMSKIKKENIIDSLKQENI